jgi:hypothetical protein
LGKTSPKEECDILSLGVTVGTRNRTDLRSSHNRDLCAVPIMPTATRTMNATKNIALAPDEEGRRPSGGGPQRRPGPERVHRRGELPRPTRCVATLPEEGPPCSASNGGHGGPIRARTEKAGTSRLSSARSPILSSPTRPFRHSGSGGQKKRLRLRRQSGLILPSSPPSRW